MEITLTAIATHIREGANDEWDGKMKWPTGNDNDDCSMGHYWRVESGQRSSIVEHGKSSLTVLEVGMK